MGTVLVAALLALVVSGTLRFLYEQGVEWIYRRSEFAWAGFCSGSGRVAYLVCPEGSAPDRSYDVVRGSR